MDDGMKMDGPGGGRKDKEKKDEQAALLFFLSYNSFSSSS